MSLEKLNFKKHSEIFGKCFNPMLLFDKSLNCLAAVTAKIICCLRCFLCISKEILKESGREEVDF